MTRPVRTWADLNVRTGLYPAEQHVYDRMFLMLNTETPADRIAMLDALDALGLFRQRALEGLLEVVAREDDAA